MDARTTQIDDAFADVASSLSRIQDDGAGMHQRIARVESVVASLHERQARLETWMDRLECKFEALDRKFDDLRAHCDKRFDDLRASFDQRLRKGDEHFAAIGERFRGIDEKLEGINLAVVTMSQRMEEGIRSIHEKLEDRPTRGQLQRWAIVTLLGVMSVALSLVAYVLRAKGHAIAADLIEAAQGK